MPSTLTSQALWTARLSISFSIPKISLDCQVSHQQPVHPTLPIRPQRRVEGNGQASEQIDAVCLDTNDSKELLVIYTRSVSVQDCR